MYVKPCIFFCKFTVVLKRTSWISEVGMKRAGLLPQVPEIQYEKLYHAQCLSVGRIRNGMLLPLHMLIVKPSTGQWLCQNLVLIGECHVCKYSSDG